MINSYNVVIMCVMIDYDHDFTLIYHELAHTK